LRPSSIPSSPIPHSLQPVSGTRRPSHRPPPDHGCPNWRTSRALAVVLPRGSAERLSLPAGEERVWSGHPPTERQSLSAQQAAKPHVLVCGFERSLDKPGAELPLAETARDRSGESSRPASALPNQGKGLRSGSVNQLSASPRWPFERASRHPRLAGSAAPLDRTRLSPQVAESVPQARSLYLGGSGGSRRGRRRNLLACLQPSDLALQLRRQVLQDA
jgi:hypothetical protein